MDMNIRKCRKWVILKFRDERLSAFEQGGLYPLYLSLGHRLTRAIGQAGTDGK